MLSALLQGLFAPARGTITAGSKFVQDPSSPLEALKAGLESVFDPSKADNMANAFGAKEGEFGLPDIAGFLGDAALAAPSIGLEMLLAKKAADKAGPLLRRMLSGPASEAPELAFAAAGAPMERGIAQEIANPGAFMTFNPQEIARNTGRQVRATPVAPVAEASQAIRAQALPEELQALAQFLEDPAAYRRVQEGLAAGQRAIPFHLTDQVVHPLDQLLSRGATLDRDAMLYGVGSSFGEMNPGNVKRLIDEILSQPQYLKLHPSARLQALADPDKMILDILTPPGTPMMNLGAEAGHETLLPRGLRAAVRDIKEQKWAKIGNASYRLTDEGLPIPHPSMPRPLIEALYEPKLANKLLHEIEQRRMFREPLDFFPKQIDVPLPEQMMNPGWRQFREKLTNPEDIERAFAELAAKKRVQGIGRTFFKEDPEEIMLRQGWRGLVRPQEPKTNVLMEILSPKEQPPWISNYTSPVRSRTAEELSAGLRLARETAGIHPDMELGKAIEALAKRAEAGEFMSRYENPVIMKLAQKVRGNKFYRDAWDNDALANDLERLTLLLRR